MRCSLSLILLLVTSIPGLAAGHLSFQVLGPLPRPPQVEKAPLTPSSKLAPELNPAEVDTNLPIDLGLGHSLKWRRQALDAEGCWTPKAPGIYWLFTKFENDRWSHVSFSVSRVDPPHIWVDTKEVDSPKEGADLIRGGHPFLMRVDISETSPLCLSVSTEPESSINWQPKGPKPITSLEQSWRLRRIGPIAISPGGKYLARTLRLRNREGKTSNETVVFGPDGAMNQPALGSSRSAPEAFAPKSGKLLLSESTKKGTSLRLVDPSTGASTTLCRNEPGLVFARFSPDGTKLLIASASGLEKEKTDSKAPRRRKALRQKLSDYQVRRQIFLIDTSSGARRLLLPAGDHIIDDVRFLPDGTGIFYLKTYPITARPWFETGIHRLDLKTGSDEILSTFRGGWEGRPSRLAPAPDGRRVAIIGPPEEVGPGHREHNVYNRALWLLDSQRHQMRRISDEEAPALCLSRSEFLAWLDQGILAGVSIRSRAGLGWFEDPGNPEAPWSFAEIPTGGEIVENVALAPDASTLAFVSQSRDHLSELRKLDLASGTITTMEQPNARLGEDWNIMSPRDESFSGPAGEHIDAWSYAALHPKDPKHQPLIVYYYGGAVPTYRAFNLEHQILAANGYEVLVLNPRGALGYGEAFADAHVNDWGPKASADILAGLDHFLQSHPEVDATRIGIYGGSYGGFMTEYLVSHSDRFAAAVAMYGISNIASYWGAGTWGFTYGDTALAGSYPWNRARLFSENSPLYKAQEIHTPLLLLHGLADVNVPEGESEQLYTALQCLGRDVELVTFPGEDHGISGSWSNRIVHRRMMLEYFDRYLKAQPEAWEKRWN